MYSDDGKLTYLIGLAFDPSGHLHVCSNGSNKVVVFTSQGEFSRCYPCENPHGIAIDKEGYCFISSNPSKVYIFNSQGNLVHSLTGFNCPDGITIAPDASIWICDMYNDRILKY